MMLSSITKRFCPLMTLILACGCGKAINDPETTSASTKLPNPQLQAEQLNLQINEAVSGTTIYKLTKIGWFKLPSSLSAENASAVNRIVTIYYNVLNSGDYDFKCTYKSLTSATELAFQKCTDAYGHNVVSDASDLAFSSDFPVDVDTSIKMVLSNPGSSAIKIKASFTVEWR